MTTRINNFFSYTLLTASAILVFSCDYSEDPGPIQEVEKEFSVNDFDRLEMGDAFNVDVEYGNYFEVSVRGDRRNVDDLEVRTEGSTLIIRYDENRNRKHDTYITITMPTLVSANFSSASNSRVSGFYDLENLDIYLSGASESQIDIEATDLLVVLSGASYLNVRGEGTKLKAELSGASVLKAFSFPVTEVDIRTSGASDGYVFVSDKLKAIASGASVVVYRGSPAVTSEVSGSSSVHQD